MTENSIIRFDDPRGGMAYPFLPSDWEWQIVSRPINGAGSLENITQADPPTLRWVKDDKVLDLQVKRMDSQVFFDLTGLRPSLHKGGYVLSKRLSRLMRPYRYLGFYDPAEITIDHNELLDGALWDGSGLVSRAFVERLAEDCALKERHRREILNSGRFEVTVMHAGGQEKGHVMVVDDLAHNFVFPAGSAKSELTMHGRVFVGLAPVHSQDQMCLDIQSLINLHPFFKPEHLLAWMQMESSLFLQGIRSGKIEALLNRLPGVESAAGLTALADWHLGEFVASGGRLMWFAGMVKAMARQHLNRLGGRERKLRFPIPGGRYYIMPADIGERNVPPGHVELDPVTATAWVNNQDWLDHIVAVLGGCDGDDAVWVFPFRDAADRRRKILVWRSPNQLGEYVLLQPTEGSHKLEWAVPGGTLAYPTMDSRLLPPRIDTVTYRYETLEAENGREEVEPFYSMATLWPTVERAAANKGTLGAYCNTLMLARALYGRLPDQLPATLEDVIDGSVKTGVNLTPVKTWTETAAEAIVRQGKHIPSALVERILPLLPKNLQDQVCTADGEEGTRHWLDILLTAVDYHRAEYWANVEALATETCPPLDLFEHGRDWLQIGQGLRQIYSQTIRRALGAASGPDDGTLQSRSTQAFDAAREASEGYLAQWPAERQHCVLLGTAATIYASGSHHGQPPNDQVLWQLGRQRDGMGRDPGIAQAFIQALREIELLGKPVWTIQGAVLYYQSAAKAQCEGVPVCFNGTWFNWLRNLQPETPTLMGMVPASRREWAKARVAQMAAKQFVGTRLTTQVTDDDRVVAWTEHDNLFGYVARGQELLAVRQPLWEIAWAMAVDGNVNAILRPICS